ncbi:hypothetical protein U1Q18_035974 [Sarracenia purpurea var. burkii]
MVRATDWMLLCVLRFQKKGSHAPLCERGFDSAVPTDGFVSLSDAMNSLGNGDIGKMQFAQLICVGGESLVIGLGPPISHGTKSLLGSSFGFKDVAQG